MGLTPHSAAIRLRLVVFALTRWSRSRSARRTQFRIVSPEQPFLADIERIAAARAVLALAVGRDPYSALADVRRKWGAPRHHSHILS